MSCPFGPNEPGHIKWIYDRIKTLPAKFIFCCAICQNEFASGLFWFCRSLTDNKGGLGRIVGPPGNTGGLQPLLTNRLNYFGGLHSLPESRRNRIGGSLSWSGDSLNNFSGSLSSSGDSLNNFNGSLKLPGRRRNEFGG